MLSLFKVFHPQGISQPADPRYLQPSIINHFLPLLHSAILLQTEKLQLFSALQNIPHKGRISLRPLIETGISEETEVCVISSVFTLDGMFETLSTAALQDEALGVGVSFYALLTFYTHLSLTDYKRTLTPNICQIRTEGINN